MIGHIDPNEVKAKQKGDGEVDGHGFVQKLSLPRDAFDVGEFGG